MKDDNLPNSLKAHPVIYARLPRKLYNKFADLAYRNESTRSALIRQLVQEAVERDEVLRGNYKPRLDKALAMK